MDKKNYPIISGRVVGVPAVLEEKGEYFTVIDYVPTGNEIKEDDMKKLMPLGILSEFVEEHRERANQTLRERVKRVTLPLRVDPSVMIGAEIRTRFCQLNFDEYEAGCIEKTYELEVIIGRSQAGGNMFLGLAEHLGAPPHSGMRYIKFLEED